MGKTPQPLAGNFTINPDICRPELHDVSYRYSPYFSLLTASM
ncbi:Hypothetical protein Cul210932_1943 [Corynebacterium ulcerans]|nr:Hypothetical protein Cul210932_1943 [Corynebacterium ulcerans]ALD95650.1 Hypothetical protein Cul131001_1975 [Corynebacterium ulcerans]